MNYSKELKLYVSASQRNESSNTFFTVFLPFTLAKLFQQTRSPM